MLAPVLIKYGSEEQKQALPAAHPRWHRLVVPGLFGARRGVRPCQPEDAARVREGDHYIVNGQKTWTTLGQYADWIFCLVRTDNSGKKQEGITFLLIDMDTPGIEVRPIKLLDGDEEVNEVFFTDVKVPVENLVGEENKGWTYAKYLLTYERTNIAGIGAAMAAFEQLKEHRPHHEAERQAADRGSAVRRSGWRSWKSSWKT